MSIDPVTLAKEIYTRERCSRNFDIDFCLHWNNPCAIVHKDTHTLAFVRPVNHLDEYENITNPAYNHPAPDAWWIYLLAGRFSNRLDWLPQRYPYVGWERDNVPRFYNYDHLLKWTTDHASIQNFSDPPENCSVYIKAGESLNRLCRRRIVVSPP